MANKPWLIIISGPNGAGKTTFHDKILEQNPFLADALFANSDNEYCSIVKQPDIAQKKKELQNTLEKTDKDIRKKLTQRFKKTMVSVGGDVHRRINEGTQKYWLDQYSMSVHIQPDLEYLLDGVGSRHDLMERIVGKDVHARINAKTEQKKSWYELYKKVLYTIECQYKLYIEPLQRKINNFETELQGLAGRKTLSKIKNAFEAGKNLIIETTGSGQTARLMAQRAREIYGYTVLSLHPYVLNPKLSIARVQKRVESGGHDVPNETVEYRYELSLKNLPSVLSNVDAAVVMDNSEKKPFAPIFAISDGYVADFAQCPEYLQNVHSEISTKFPKKTPAELLCLPENIDMSKLTEEQRENFAQIIITNLINQHTK